MKQVGKMKMTPEYTVDEGLPKEMQWLGYIEPEEDGELPPLWIDAEFNVWSLADDE